MSKIRDPQERRAIVRAMIAGDDEALKTFQLSDAELIFYQVRSARAVEAVAAQGAQFKQYYTLPTANPFAYVAITSAVVVTVALVVGVEVYRNTQGTPPYPIYGALLALAGVAIGWWVVGRNTHRNTIRQNTNAMVFARFSHGPFNDALHRFHRVFGYDPTLVVTRERMVQLRESGSEEDFDASVAVLYLLNYLEFVATGVMNGDLDGGIVRQTMRGFVNYYYDKSEPYITHARRLNHRSLENLTKLRLAYRDV